MNAEFPTSHPSMMLGHLGVRGKRISLQPRYLSALSDRVTGVDIDADNVAMCARSFPGATFIPIERHPPTPFSADSFDLILGISVFTHLDETTQHAWLAELQRIVQPGGLLILTILGQAQAHLYQSTLNDRLATSHQGISVQGTNSQLSDVMDDPTYYVNVQHSHDYVMATWGAYFDIIEIVPALGCTQDAVVLRARPR